MVRLLGVFWPVQQYPEIYQNKETMTYGGSTVLHSKAKVDGLDPTYKVSPPRACRGAYKDQQTSLVAVDTVGAPGKPGHIDCVVKL